MLTGQLDLDNSSSEVFLSDDIRLRQVTIKTKVPFFSSLRGFRYTRAVIYMNLDINALMLTLSSG